MFNMDEKGCKLQLPHSFAKKGSKRVQFIEKEHDGNINIVACGNVTGSVILPTIPLLRLEKIQRRKKVYLQRLGPNWHQRIVWPLFTKLLTSELTQEFCNPLDDWLNWWIQTNHQTDYIIRWSTLELKVWWIRAIHREAFVKIWRHFARFKPSGLCFLIFDGTNSHFDYNICEFAEENVINLYGFSSNTRNNCSLYIKVVSEAMKSFRISMLLFYFTIHREEQDISRLNFTHVFAPIWEKRTT